MIFVTILDVFWTRFGSLGAASTPMWPKRSSGNPGNDPTVTKKSAQKTCLGKLRKSVVSNSTQTPEMTILYNSVIDFHGCPSAEEYPEKPPK